MLNLIAKCAVLHSSRLYDNTDVRNCRAASFLLRSCCLHTQLSVQAMVTAHSCVWVIVACAVVVRAIVRSLHLILNELLQVLRCIVISYRIPFLVPIRYNLVDVFKHLKV